jgi:hypothetical protein
LTRLFELATFQSFEPAERADWPCQLKKSRRANIVNELGSELQAAREAPCFLAPELHLRVEALFLTFAISGTRGREASLASFFGEIRCRDPSLAKTVKGELAGFGFRGCRFKVTNL